METAANGQRCWLLWLGGDEGMESDWGSLEEQPLRKLPGLFTQLTVEQMNFLLE